MEKEALFVSRARSYELDALGHVNHAVYLNWFEQARWDALELAGLPAAEILRRGWGIHVVRIEVDYRAEVRLGDTVRIRTGVEAFRNSSMTIRQRLVRVAPGTDPEEVHAADARVVAVWIGENGRPMRIPEDVRQGFTRWEADQSMGR
jgi:acyl-CoA thioester hydrolase